MIKKKAFRNYCYYLLYRLIKTPVWPVCVSDTLCESVICTAPYLELQTRSFLLIVKQMLYKKNHWMYIWTKCCLRWIPTSCHLMTEHNTSCVSRTTWAADGEPSGTNFCVSFLCHASPQFNCINVSFSLQSSAVTSLYIQAEAASPQFSCWHSTFIFRPSSLTRHVLIRLQFNDPPSA